jgi:hypothetical protein
MTLFDMLSPDPKTVVQEVRVSDVATRTMLVKPPEPKGGQLIPSPGERGVFIGKTGIMKKPVFWQPEKAVNPHCAVLGGSGFGKTTLIVTKTSRINMAYNANILVIDFTGEYVPYAELVGGHVIRLGQDAINILDLAGTSPGIRAKQAEVALQPFLETDRASRQSRILRILAEESYRAKGITEDFETWNKEPPTLKDVCNLLKGLILDVFSGEWKDKAQDGEYSPEMREAVYMLAGSSSMRESSMGLLEKLEVYTRPPHDVFARQSTLQVEELFESGYVVLSLTALPDEKSKATVAITILQLLVEYMRKEISKELRLVVVLDEAWKVANMENSPVRPLVKEGRKYGVGIIVATQEIVDTENYMINNAATIFLLKMKGNDREAAIKALALNSSMADMLEKMDVGDAISLMDLRGENTDQFTLHVEPVFLDTQVTIKFRPPSNPLRRIFQDALKRYRAVRP